VNTQASLLSPSSPVKGKRKWPSLVQGKNLHLVPLKREAQGSKEGLEGMCKHSPLYVHIPDPKGNPCTRKEGVAHQPLRGTAQAFRKFLFYFIISF
jgi:hypothetical protein